MSRFITFMLIAVILVSSVLYISFSGAASSLGYTYESESEKLVDLQERRNNIIIELANIQTPTSLTEYSETLQLVEAREISGYINNRDGDLGLSNR